MKKTVFVSTILLLCSCIFCTAAPVIRGSVNRSDGIFRCNEEIIFTLTPVDAPSGAVMNYVVSEYGKAVRKNTAPADKPLTVSVKLEKPGHACVTATLAGIDGKPVKAGGACGVGAIVEPEKLQPGSQEPADFDAFWQSRKELLKKHPMKLLEKKEVPAGKNFKAYDIKVSCPGNAPVSGYLTLPENAAKKSLPLKVTYHAFGVYSAGIKRDNGAVCFDVNAHGIPNGRPKTYYREMAQKLGWYPAKGKGDREKTYFHDMYLRIMRALEFAKTVPEWNGRVLIVSGGSQGAGQAIAAAALDPDVSGCVAYVPALTDHAGHLQGRKPGWPGLFRDDARETGLYYDGVFFARRIRCSVILTAGYIDNIVAPTSVWVVYNNLVNTDKKMIFGLPTTGHSVGGPPALHKAVRMLEKGE
ncbi:MAG: acetylxylan esterase [Lentisphaeria bacterium]|nr:acetylxylan esterase [Lentisphaeria bacterium]